MPSYLSKNLSSRKAVTAAYPGNLGKTRYSLASWILFLHVIYRCGLMFIKEPLAD